jgi:hypothetical protein
MNTERLCDFAQNDKIPGEAAQFPLPQPRGRGNRRDRDDYGPTVTPLD